MALEREDRDAIVDAIKDGFKNAGGGGGGGGGDQGGYQKLKNAASGAAEAAGDLTGALLTGKADINTFGKAFSTVGKGFGPFGKALGGGAQAITAYITQSAEAFRDMSKVGVSLGGDLGEFQVRAAQTRMPLEQFGKLVKNNAADLAAFGGSASRGTRRFAELSQAMFEGGAIDGFMRLGMTIEESNEFLMDYTAMSRRSARFQQMNAQQQAASAAEMAKQFDIVAKLTGKNAKELKDEVMERQNAGATQAKLRLLEKQGVAGAVDAYNAAQTGLQSGPAVLRNLMDDLLQTGVPMSEATANFAATNKEAYALAKQAAEATKAGNVEEAQRLSEQAAAAALEYANSEQGLRLASLAQVSDIAQGQATALEETGKVIDAMAETAKRMGTTLNEAGASAEVFKTMLQDLAAEQTTQVEASGKAQAALKAVTEVEQGIANLSSNIRQGAGTILSDGDAVTNALSGLADSINESLNGPDGLDDNLREFIAAIDSSTNRINEAKLLGLDKDATRTDIEQEKRNQADGTEVQEARSFFDKLGSFLTGGGFKATGGTISPGNAYVVGERGPEIISGSAGTVMSNTQSNNAVTQSAQNGAQDMSKLIGAMETANEQLSTLIAINTRQAVLGDKQVKAIRGAGNLIKGI